MSLLAKAKPGFQPKDLSIRKERENMLWQRNLQQVCSPVTRQNQFPSSAGFVGNRSDANTTWPVIAGRFALSVCLSVCLSLSLSLSLSHTHTHAHTCTWHTLNFPLSLSLSNGLTSGEKTSKDVWLVCSCQTDMFVGKCWIEGTLCGMLALSRAGPEGRVCVCIGEEGVQSRDHGTRGANNT
jgi:hypothetical protein